MTHSLFTRLAARGARLLAICAALALGAAALRAQDEPPEPVWPEAAPGAVPLGTKPLPPGALARTTYEVLGDALKAILAESGDGMRIGMYVEDADLRIPVADVGGTDLYSPGATLLLPTMAAALDRLGPNYRFTTTLSTSGELVGRTLKGNLIVSGTGDPTLGTVLAKGDKAPTDVFRRWADEIKHLSIGTVTGAVIADDSYFDNQFEGPDWPIDERGTEYLAQVSALSFHGNCVDLTWKSGWWRGKIPECVVSPIRQYASVHTEVMTAAKSSGLHLHVDRDGTNNVFRASGIMPVRSTARIRASVHNPSLYFATALRQTLQANGISINRARPVAIGDLDVADREAVTSGTSPVAIEQSPPLDSIVPAALRNGDLMTADLLLKAMGRKAWGTGSFAAGSDEVLDFMRTRARSGVTERLFDGSGRSRLNAVSPRGMAGVVSAMSAHRAAEAFESGLARPGGAQLAGWFDKLRKDDPAIAKRLVAYTGQGRAYMALVGRITTKGGARLSFALMCEQAGFKPEPTREVFEKIVARMAVSPLQPPAPAAK